MVSYFNMSIRGAPNLPSPLCPSMRLKLLFLREISGQSFKKNFKSITYIVYRYAFCNKILTGVITKSDVTGVTSKSDVTGVTSKSDVTGVTSKSDVKTLLLTFK